MPFTGAIIVYSNLSKAEVARRISNRVFGGVPFVDDYIWFGRRVYDEVPNLRTMNPILGYYIDLVGDDSEVPGGDSGGWYLYLSPDMDTWDETYHTEEMELTDLIVALLNGIDGIRAVSGMAKEEPSSEGKKRDNPAGGSG